MPDVTVVGAGLAGLACARHLQAAGREVVVLEAQDAPGGRVRTDVVDGVRLDRGFQVLNTGYPELRRAADLDALQLRPFVRGALVRWGDRLHRVGDPRSVPTWALTTAAAPFGLKDKALLAREALQAAAQHPQRLLARPETTTARALRDRGLSDEVVDRFLRPFLAGVFLEEELTTSSRFFDLVWRSFALGVQAVPAAGVQALPDQLADGLDVRYGERVEVLPPGPVVVATDPVTAGGLLGLAAPTMRSVTTHYHLAPEPPTPYAAIALDGERSGPVGNSVVLTNAAPSYAPGRHLVSSSVVSGEDDEPTVRAHLTRLWGVETREWEHVAACRVAHALPDQSPPMGRFRRDVRLERGRLYVCGDSRDSASQQGALVSGRRAAAALLEDTA